MPAVSPIGRNINAPKTVLIGGLAAVVASILARLIG